MATSSLQVAGLASSFDWKSFIDKIMDIERQPENRLASEQAQNSQKSDLLSILGTKITALQASVTDLAGVDLFGKRTATSGTTGSTWSSSAAANTATGVYKIAVSKLATTTKTTSTIGVSSALASDANLTGVTLANMRTSIAPTAGTFTVNGVRVTVALTDSLYDVMERIRTDTAAAGDEVGWTYNPGTDQIELTSASGNLVLGAANDDSNLLTALKLFNNAGGTSPITSSGELGVVKNTAALASAGFATTPVGDGSGDGVFTINGESISYNVNTDTLSSIITKINNSDANVTATYDVGTDKVVLTNKKTGDLGLTVSDTTGNLMAALNLAGATASRGQDAEFTINDDSTVYRSASNTLDGSVHGITGLSVTVDSETTQTITVAADTGGMRSKIEAFVSKYNDILQYIEDETAIKVENGKVSTKPLYSNREVQEWGRSLRSKVFATVTGVAGSITQLDKLGIDFDEDDNLVIYDSDKLNAALADDSADVAAFFQTDTTGFADRLATYLDAIGEQNTDQQERLTAANDDIDEQIAAIERRLEQQRELMESAFIAMETAQSKIQQQQSLLTNALAKITSSK